MSKPIQVTDTDFGEKVLANEKPVLVDFWAPWCGPCRMIAPSLEKMAEERADLVIAKLDVDQNQQTAYKYQIMSIPNMKMFYKGEVIGELVGAMPYEALLAKVEELLKRAVPASEQKAA